MDRALSRSLPFLPRYHSVSPARAPRKFSSTRSLSQPSHRIIYIEGNRSKLTNSYAVPKSPRPSPASSPAPSPSRATKVILLNPKLRAPLYRISKSNSWNDLNTSHVYSSMECLYDRAKRIEQPGVASAASCEDIYHKGPYYPDASQSESGVSVGESEDGGEDDTASQISYGSSSAFFETTIDSEFDRYYDSDNAGDRTLDISDVDSTDGGPLSPAPKVGGSRGHGRSSDRGITSPLSYSEARRRELMSSPSWEFEKTQSKYHALKLAIPSNDPDHKSRREGGVSTPLAQSTPHVSPRSFYGPKLSIKGSWNVDNPPDDLVGDAVEKPAAARSLFDSSLSDMENRHDKMEDTSCYSSFSEDNASGVYSQRPNTLSLKKSKLLKKASDRPAQKYSSIGLSLPKQTGDDQDVDHRENTELALINCKDITPEELGVYIPPLETAIGLDETGRDGHHAAEETAGEGQWWAVYNIGSAKARQEAGQGEGMDVYDSDVKMVKPVKTGIPLLSPGKHGQEKLKKSLSPTLESSAESKRKSPPLLSLSPNLKDRIGKREHFTFKNETRNDTLDRGENESQGEQPQKLVQVNSEDGCIEGNLPSRNDQVASYDRLNAHATCWEEDNNSDHSHGHQNTSMTTADGVDEASTNNRHYPLGNLSVRGQAKEVEEEERVERGMVTSTHHTNDIKPGGNKQVAVPGGETSEFISNGLPIADPLSFPDGLGTGKDTYVSQENVCNQISDSHELFLSVSLLPTQSSSTRLDNLCQEFEGLSLNEVDFDATLVNEGNNDTLSEWAPATDSSNANVNTNIDTGYTDAAVVTETVVENGDLSILSGNIGQEKTNETESANMNRNTRNSNSALFCLNCDSGKGVGVQEGCECDCRTGRYVDPIITRSTESPSQGSWDGEKRIRRGGDGYDIRQVRVVATAQMPAASVRDNNGPIDGVCDGDIISTTHSFIPLRFGDSRSYGEQPTLAHGDEQDDAPMAEITSRSFDQLSSGEVPRAIIINANNADDCHHHSKKADILLQQEGFRPDHKDNKRGGLDGHESINYSTSGGRRGDKGIPQVEEKETNAQKDGESAEGTRQTGSVFLLRQSSPSSLRQQSTPPQSQTARPGDSNGVNLTKIVKQIHRKTVEETVIIERSVVSPTYSGSSGSGGGGGGVDTGGVLDYVTSSTNRKETVIDEKVDYISSTSYELTPTLDLCDNRNNENDYNNSREDSKTVSSETTNQSVIPDNSPVVSSNPLIDGVLNQPSEQPVFQSNTLFTPIHPAHGVSPYVEPNENTSCDRSSMRGDTIESHDNTLHDSAFHTHSFDTTPTTKDLTMESSHIHHSFPTHQSVLDNLQAQLSHISGSGCNGQEVEPQPRSVPAHHHHDTHYHDHGEATSVLNKKVNNDSRGVSGINEHITHQHTPSGVIASMNEAKGHISSDHRERVTGAALNNNNNTPKHATGSETYDNDYDNISGTNSRTDSHSLPTRHSHHVLLKPGHIKSSSLWTLQEETESLLEGLSPKSSPKRYFSTTANSADNNNTGFKSDSNGQFNDSNSDSKESFNSYEFMDENRNIYPSRSLISAWGQSRHPGSDSSGYVESDGNYSPLSTTDSCGHGSSSGTIDRQVTASSLSDIGAGPGGFSAHKLDSEMAEAPASPLPADSISSFYDFVNGLEMGAFTFDLANKSHVSQFERESNQIRSPDTQQQVRSPITPIAFNTSQAFSVNSLDSSSNSTVHATSFGKNDFVDSTGRRVGPISLAVFSSPFTNSEDILDSSIASSSHQSSNQDIQNEGSSRLQALDLDLSRISSCASPTPSDFSEGSMYTCTGTAEIKKSLSVSFDDDYDMLPAPKHIPSSTPKQTKLKSALKKSTPFDSHRQDSFKREEWVKQFDQIIEDFNNKTCPLGPDPDLVFLEEKRGETEGTGSTSGDMYKLFTTDDTERKQNHTCIVEEEENMDTFRFKRFLKKSHTRRNRGKRIVRFLSRLSCVSESVQLSPDHSACRKKGRLGSGQAYSTDSMPLPEEREPVLTSSATFQLHHRKSPTHNSNDNSPTSSNQSLDSLRSRTDSAYSSVSESAILNSPSSLKGPRQHHSSSSPASGNTRYTLVSHPDSAFSSISSDVTITASEADTLNPLSPSLPEHSGDYSSDMLSALSDVFDQLDVCEEKIDQALLSRLRYGHRSFTPERKN